MKEREMRRKENKIKERKKRKEKKRLASLARAVLGKIIVTDGMVVDGGWWSKKKFSDFSQNFDTSLARAVLKPSQLQPRGSRRPRHYKERSTFYVILCEERMKREGDKNIVYCKVDNHD